MTSWTKKSHKNLPFKCDLQQLVNLSTVEARPQETWIQHGEIVWQFHECWHLLGNPLSNLQIKTPLQQKLLILHITSPGGQSGN